MSDDLKNSLSNKKNGRYNLGGVTETSPFALEWWDRRFLEPDPSDILYFVEKKYENKPDLLGYVFYGDAGLWWIIAQHNTILDPLNELTEGTLLVIPTYERAKKDLLKSNDGIASTRGNAR